jgi:hypothetical protein
MNPSAQVDSIEALGRLHAALAKFGSEAHEALAVAAAEVRRTVAGIEERLAWWQGEVNRWHEEVGRARSDLAHHRALDGGRTGAVEQEIALARARQRLAAAEEKVGVCRRWLIQLPDAILEFEGPARQLAGMLDADLRVALAILLDRIGRLQAYTAVAPPASTPPPAARPPEEPT